jgi:hypothetical protein
VSIEEPDHPDAQFVKKVSHYRNIVYQIQDNLPQMRTTPLEIAVFRPHFDTGKIGAAFAVIIRMVKLLYILFSALLVSCATDIDRGTVNTYYLKNASTSAVHFIGFRQETGPGIDTMFVLAIEPRDSLLIKSMGSGNSQQSPLPIDSCVSVIILKDDTFYNKSVNPGKFRKSIDSFSVFFDFKNPRYWSECRRVDYNPDGPQMREVFFEFVVE